MIGTTTVKEDKEESSYKPVPSPRKTLEKEPEQPKTVPVKPYTEVVKVQRPEVTRGDRQRSKPKPYVERLAETKPESSKKQDPASIKAQQRLYGKV